MAEVLGIISNNNSHINWYPCFLLMQGLTNLKKLYLDSMPDMRCIWKGLVLSKLTTLEVVECKRLTQVFTCGMIASLVQLKILKIFSCEELEQIIAKDNDDEKDQILPGDHLQSLCFPNLCQIDIRKCNKLKSLFPVVMASGLPKLNTLRVSEASQLLGVFGQENHASPVNVEKEMMLPNLWELSLEQLSSIVCFSFECCYFLFPRLEKLKVHQCPKLTTKFATTPDGSMSAQSEVLLIWLDFLPLFLVCLFLVSLNNKIYKLKWACHICLNWFTGIRSSWRFKH